VTAADEQVGAPASRSSASARLHARCYRGDQMRTVVLGERPRVLDEFIARRRALGQDVFDEVWDGEYHVVPGPSAEHGRVPPGPCC
jgi:hypothetical protein